MKASTFATFLFSSVLTILATDCPAEVPRVETNFGQIVLDQRPVGKRFRDIIPSERIQRIIRLAGQDYDLPVQADYDGLIAHLIASNEKANEKASIGFGPHPNERTSSRLLFVTTDNQIFEVEILSRGLKPANISAILIRGAGIGARIDVKDFKRTAPRK